MPVPTRTRRLLVPAAAALVAAVAAAPAYAHSEAVASSPRHGSTLTRVPAQMTVTFGEPIGRLGTMRVTRNRAGDLVRSARIAPGNARRAVITLKRPGPRKQAGLYRLTWRVTSADGHPVSGVVVFRVRT
jgi:copper resistance protein C